MEDKEKLNTYITSVLKRGIFDNDVKSERRPIETVKAAFMAGSSKHGNANRADVGSNCVTPNDL